MATQAKQGDLVRVLPEHLLDNQDEDACAAHGYLWIVNRVDRRGQTLRCRALATGREWIWFYDEVETCNDKQDADT